jgi:hypothetical protein
MIERDPQPEAPLAPETDESPRPVDQDDREGPTAGAEEPELPGPADEAIDPS